MNIKKLELTIENLFLLDQFFKIQFNDNYRYGQMGYFYWKLLKNRAGLGFLNYYNDNNKIIATTSVTPKSLIINSKEKLVAEIGDTYVDKLAQGKGLFTSLVKISTKDSENMHFMYGTPNHLSMPIYLSKCNFFENKLFRVQSFVRPLNIVNFLKKRIGYIPALILSFFYKIFVRVNIMFSNIIFNSSKNFSYEKIEFFDDNFNKFWDLAIDEWDFIFKRNKEMLEWRFSLNPKKYNKLVFKKNDLIIGYLVYTLSYNDGDSKLTIADFLFLKQYKSALGYAINVLNNTALEKNINSINLWYSLQSEFTKILIQNSFYRFNQVPIIFNKPSEEISVPLNNVHFTISDSDNI